MKRILLAASLLFPLAALAQDYPSPTLRAATVLNGITTGTLAASGNGSFGGTLGVTGAATFSSTGNFAGALTAQVSQTIGTNAGTTSQLTMLGAASQNKDIRFFSGGTGASNLRWRLRNDTSDNLTITAIDNSGATVGAVLSMTRLTGRTTFAFPVQGVSFQSLPGTVNYSGTLNNDSMSLYSLTTVTGTIPANYFAQNYIRVQSTADATGQNNWNALRVTQVSGGGSTDGPYVAFHAHAQATGAFVSDMRVSAAYLHTDIQTPSNAIAPAVGGTIWASNPHVHLYSGALNYAFVYGEEVDLEVAAGASVRDRVGVSVHLSGNDAVQGTRVDAAFRAAGAAADTHPGFLSVMDVGGPATDWPVDGTNGELIRAWAHSSFSGTPSVAPKAMTGGAAFDLFPVAWGNSTFNYNGGQIGPAGEFIVSTGQLRSTATGIELDIPYQRVSAAAVSGGASGLTCFAGEKIWDPSTGTVLSVSTVDGSARATAVTISTAGRSTSPPANPVSFSGQACHNVNITVTWSAALNRLDLNPSGGNTRIGTGSALATNASAGFPLIPTMAGAPTGAVGAAGQAAMVIDTTNKKLCYSTGGGTWECSAAFTP